MMPVPLSRGVMNPLSTRILALAVLTSILFYYGIFRTSDGRLWDSAISSSYGGGDEDADFYLNHARDRHVKSPLQDEQFQFQAASDASHPYTWTLVLASITTTDMRWVNNSLTTLRPPHGNLQIAQYVNNEPSAPLHPPMNKGNEAMAYLTYLVDYYDHLPDISVFMHGSGTSWHNNDFLNYSSANILHHLNLDKVRRDGYVNLRCQWEPGCPAQVRPFREVFAGDRLDEPLYRDAWQEMFGVDEAAVPRVLAQPCCAQFALSREAIRRVPRARYAHLQQWIMTTTIGSGMVGMLFEYVWQFLFLGKETYCQDPRICYCDTYGMCVQDHAEYDTFFDLRRKVSCLERQRQGNAEDQFSSWSNGGKADRIVSATEGARLKKEERETWAQLEKMIAGFLQTGRDPAKRAAAMKAAWQDWKWMPNDDGGCAAET